MCFYSKQKNLAKIVAIVFRNELFNIKVDDFFD